MNEDPKKYILKNFNFLRDEGFLFKEEVRKSTVDGGLDTVQYIFIKNIIKIRISFYRFESCNELDITVSKLNKDSCFSFDEYMISKSYQDYFSHENESIEDYISRIANIFQIETETALKDVLNGKKWVDVPIDYSRIR